MNAIPGSARFAKDASGRAQMAHYLVEDADRSYPLGRFEGMKGAGIRREDRLGPIRHDAACGSLVQHPVDHPQEPLGEIETGPDHSDGGYPKGGFDASRVQSDTCAGWRVSATTRVNSSLRAAKSACSRTRSPNAASVRAASYFRR